MIFYRSSFFLIKIFGGILWGNITDGELCIMTYCDRCGKELFRRAERGRFIVDKGAMFQHIHKYEDLPKGWVIIGTDLLCPYCSTRVFQPHDGERKTLRASLGATLDLTEAQYNDIMDIVNAENDPDTAFKAFKAVIDAGCFKIDGDCYILGENGEEIAEFDI